MNEHADYVIIVAGGSGRRMGGDVPKQFLPVGGKPVLMRTIERFAAADSSLNIILVLPAAHREWWHELCRDYSFDVAHTVVDGGATRYESSQRGIAFIPATVRGLVAIHDGVRPFVSAATIGRCFSAARLTGAAIPVLPLTDSLRRLDGGGGSHNVARSDYRVVQTPQVFDIGVARRAFEAAYDSAFTDDASVVEASGHAVTMVDGNRENIKLTTPFDLIVAEALLKEDARG